MRAIAREADVSTGNAYYYYYFSSKEELVQQFYVSNQAATRLITWPPAARCWTGRATSRCACTARCGR